MAKKITILLGSQNSTKAENENQTGFEAKLTAPESIDIDPKRIKDYTEEVLESIDELNLKEKSNYYLDEITLNIGINGKGKLGILGYSVEAGGQVGITLKLKRKKQDATQHGV